MARASIARRALWLIPVQALLCSAFPPLAQNNIPPLPGEQLDVSIYRDANGVPHIEADDEEVAWYALGYEEARDALYWVQLNLKRFRGRLTEFMGSDGGSGLFGRGTNFENDAIVQLLEIDLKTVFGEDEERLKEYLRREPDSTGQIVGNPDQVFLNLKAYAAGLNDYRKRLRFMVISQLNGQELAHRRWINQTAPWVLTEPITVWEVAAFGPWVMRKGGVPAATSTELSRFCKTMPDPCNGLIAVPPPVEDPFHEEGEPLPDGSNAFCWNYELSQGMPQYSGVMGDATGAAAKAYADKTKNDINAVGHHRWFAHIVVPSKDPLNDPGIDVFGELVHGTGMFIHFHNRDVAYGGSQATPNRGDGFMLRVGSSNENGFFDEYYSYYTNSWQPLTLEPVDVCIADCDGPGRMEETIQVFRPGRFGFAIPENDGQPKVFYVRDTTDWNVGPISLFSGSDQSSNDAACCPPESPEDPSLPVFVAFRVPGDPRVHASAPFPEPGGFQLLGRFAVGLYEAMRAETVYRFQELARTRDVGRGTNFCAIDREGRIFAGMMGNIPQRGDDAKICTLERPDGTCVSTLDKFDLYDKGRDREPVPARWDSDEKFDWIFGADGEVEYLLPEGQGSTGEEGNPIYLPYILYDPTDPSRNHPPAVPDTGDTAYENPGFVAASNDFVHFYYKKRQTIDYKDNPVDPHMGGNLLNQHWSPDNAVLNSILEAGTFYANRDIRLNFAGGGNPGQIGYMLNVRRGLEELMDEDAAVDFGWSNWYYGEYDYEGFYPAGGGEPQLLNQDLPSLPPFVRSLEELRLKMPEVLAEADREVRFFRDLWETLWDGRWDQYEVEGGDPNNPTDPLPMDLKFFWVDNGHRPSGGRPRIFWYPDGENIEFFEMPKDYALIDFLWSEIRLGAKKVEVDDVNFDAGFDHDTEQPRYGSLVSDLLVSWDVHAPGEETKFRRARNSVSAALVEEYAYGYQAAKNGYDRGTGTVLPNARFVEGRMWSPVSNGHVLVDPHRYPVNDSWANIGTQALDDEGGLPCPVDSENRFTTCGQSGFLQQLVHSYNNFNFHFGALGSLLTDDESQPNTIHKILKHPVPPYSALYSDPLTFTVKEDEDLTKQDINDLVTFFLVELGGFKLKVDDDDADALGSTSKVGSVEKWLGTDGEGPIGSSPNSLPWDAAYPLTRNLVRVLLMRRLLETDDFLEAEVPTKQLGAVIRTRIYDFEGTLRFPPEDIAAGTENGRATQGAVAKLGDNPDAAVGFQSRIWNIGGSNKPLMTLLPANPLLPPKSYFCLFPGQRNGVFRSPHFPDLAENYTTRTLAPTYYDPLDPEFSYLDPMNWSEDPGLPQSPYKVPQ